MKGMLIFLWCLISASTATYAEGGGCEAMSRNIQQCTIPSTKDKQTVKVSDQLSATFNTYKTAQSSGIFIQFQSGKDVLRRVYLSFDEPDKETGDRMTVDLRKKIPSGASLKALEFEGTQQSVIVRLVHQKDGKIGKVDVFGAN